ncbi:MAG TPA: hypothetical protein VI357_26085 [Mycobacteriales bacterium]
MNPEPEWISGGPPAPPASRTGRRLAVAGIAAAALAVGGVAVAQAATSNTPTPSASPSSGAPGTTDRGPRVHSPHLAGTVVSASDGTITITDFEGFQRTIHTSSATTYSDGLTATPAAGTRIVAEGTVDSDKTSLKATKIAKMPDRPGPGRGFPGGPGGWPGRHHDRDGTPPSGAPTPPSGVPTPPSGSATPPAPPTPSASPTS